MKKSSFLVCGAVSIAALLTLIPACSSDTGETGADAGAGRRFTGTRRPAASCEVLLESPDVLASPHVPEGTAIQYNSTPPSSGPHFASWANFIEFSKPVPMGNLVHSMEHGAVVLLYKCDSPTGPGCADLVAGLRKIRDAVKTDPMCTSAIRARIVIAPEPTLPRPIAAAAWGFTYQAACVDAPTLSQFITENYALGPENFCTEGVSAF